MSYFRRSSGNQAGKNQRAVPCVSDLMIFITMNENRTTGFYRYPFVFTKYLSLTGMNEYLMLPFVGMSRRIAVFSHFKNSHAEIFGTVCLADCDSCADALYGLAVEMFGRYVGIMSDFHQFSFLFSDSYILNIFEFPEAVSDPAGFKKKSAKKSSN
jgi:hypothetical protein